MFRTLAFLSRHPLTRANPAGALARFAVWQIGSRIVTEHTHTWISGAKLVVRNGMTGATGNIYCGLHEFADMGFVLHFLRPEDTFLDIGANIGSYTVLASAVCGATTIAFEPDPGTAENFQRNVSVNGIADCVVLHKVALGHDEGRVAFTIGRDTENRVADSSDTYTRSVQVLPLDAIEGARDATLMKLDVEGYESEVLAGAAKTLASPALLAIETEAQETAVTDLIETFGFVRRWYDPFSRTLACSPLPHLPASNALFVRDDDAVLARLVSAQKFRVLSHLI